MTQTFNAAKFQETARKARLAEQFIVEEARKMGVDLSAEQARIFANAVLKVYAEPVDWMTPVTPAA